MSDRTSDSESLLEMTDQSQQITDDISVETGGCDLVLYCGEEGKTWQSNEGLTSPLRSYSPSDPADLFYWPSHK